MTMLACRLRPRSRAGFSFFNITLTRFNSSTSTSQPSDSIFTAPESPWDHVFSDIDPNPPPDSTTLSKRNKRHGPRQNQHLIQRSSSVRRQRASITAREMSVFDDMFDLIFNAVSGKDGKVRQDSLPSSSSSVRTPTVTSSAPGQTPSIGGAGAPLHDFFRTLRRHTSRARWTTAIDEELDRKRETMELLNTDHELLHWMTVELFGESQQWDEEAKRAIAASAGTTKDEGHAQTGSSTSSSSSGLPGAPPIHHSIYPHLIAHGMRIFRTTYSNPSLSLAIFNHAARVSIPSYVFGCTAPAYNELMEAKWEGWGDLQGVCNALEEMRLNGVKIDGRTRLVVENVRREVGEARPVDVEEAEGHEDVNPLAKKVWRELGEVEVMKLLHRIERLVLRERSRTPTASPHEESWKNAILHPVQDDGWSFDGWNEKRTGRKLALG